MNQPINNQTKILEKVKNRKKVLFSDMEKLLEIYGFEIDKSSGGAHWIVRNDGIRDEQGNRKDLPFWRPHGRRENFLSPKTKKMYLDYIEQLMNTRSGLS